SLRPVRASPWESAPRAGARLRCRGTACGPYHRVGRERRASHPTAPDASRASARSVARGPLLSARHCLSGVRARGGSDAGLPHVLSLKEVAEVSAGWVLVTHRHISRHAAAAELVALHAGTLHMLMRTAAGRCLVGAVGRVVGLAQWARRRALIT